MGLAKKMRSPLGSGGRFRAVEEEAAKHGAEDPAASREGVEESYERTV